MSHQPKRGDEVEAWLKAERDRFVWGAGRRSARFRIIDNLLDAYRLHADSGTPLGEKVEAPPWA